MLMSITPVNGSAEKIAALRARLADAGLDGFLVPKADEFQGEFPAPYAERLQWLSGFSGSAGIAVVLAAEACVLTDARYRLQVARQVDPDIFQTADSVRCGVHGWLNQQAQGGVVIGYDPWLHTPDQIQKIKDEVKHARLEPVAANPVDAVWLDRPEKPCGAVEVFAEKIAGRSFREKHRQLAALVGGKGAQAVILTLPESVCWLLNMRGRDLDYTPAILSYAVVYADASQPVEWIVEPQKLAGLELPAGVRPAALADLARLDGPVLLDFARSPEWFKTTLEQRGVEVINAKDPSLALKAVKSPAEYAALQRAHIADGAALVRFLHWLQTADAPGELDIDAKLLELRAQHPAFRQASFPTIAGFGANGAVIHYRATPDSSLGITGDGLLLVDSGGQYYGGDVAGTTDITRTVAVGRPSAEMIRHFTLVLKGHIALATARFPAGTTGQQIDALARQPLWRAGLDYAHGTGHGVGCYLGVHEDAAAISPRSRAALRAGMLLSNEPGYYREGAYGIRIENLVFVREAGHCAATDTPLLAFETLSYAPIDRTLIDKNLLTAEELAWLNAYHRQVDRLLAPALAEEERQWLHRAAAPL